MGVVVVMLLLLLAVLFAVFLYRRFPARAPAAPEGRRSSGGPGFEPGAGASAVLASVSAVIGAAVAKVARLRKGQAGDWRAHLSAEQAARFEALLAERLRGSGLERACGS